MIRHCVLLTLSDDAPEGQVDLIIGHLRALPDAIPEIEAYVVGSDAGLAEGNADIAVVGDFADDDAYRVYAAHPAHIQVIDDHIRPWLAGRTAVQHRL